MLGGTRVVDLTQWLPGPAAGQCLADLGAEVVKVEPPAGDPMRGLGPLDADGVSAWYKLVNAGKTVVRLDLKAETGRAGFAALLAGADVLLESYRPGTLAKLGFERARLRTLNPGLVHCALSGYGQGGPLAAAGGHDINYMALAGGLAASGTAERPVPAFPPVADHASALQAVIAVLAALLRRARSGAGADLDISLAETVLAWQALPMTAALRDGGAAGRERGVLNGGAAFYRVYETADGRFVTLGAIEPKFWVNFCDAVGRPDWAARQHEPLPQAALIAEVAALFAGRDLAHWQARLATVDCCFQPVLEAAEVLAHPQVAARRQLVATAGPEPAVAALFAGWIDGRSPPPRRPLQERPAAAVLDDWR